MSGSGRDNKNVAPVYQISNNIPNTYTRTHTHTNSLENIPINIVEKPKNHNNTWQKGKTNRENLIGSGPHYMT